MKYNALINTCRNFLFVSLLAVGLLAEGCVCNVKSDDVAETEESEYETELGKDIDQSLGELKETLNEAFNEEGGDAPAIDHRKLKEFLPDELGRMEREDYKGSSGSLGGLGGSAVTGIYRGGDKKIEITITDLSGGLASLASSVLKNAKIEVDEESKHGYKRTTEYRGHKMFEEFNHRREYGKKTVFIGRFIVAIDGNNVDEDDLQDALEEIPFRKLERLAKEKRKET